MIITDVQSDIVWIVLERNNIRDREKEHGFYLSMNKKFDRIQSATSPQHNQI